jgi:predicted transcriptional regulator
MTESVDRILAATTQIVTAWLEANAVTSAALPGVIRAIYGLQTDLAGC